jgi:hypothetical protein
MPPDKRVAAGAVWGVRRAAHDPPLTGPVFKHT